VAYIQAASITMNTTTMFGQVSSYYTTVYCWMNCKRANAATIPRVIEYAHTIALSRVVQNRTVVNLCISSFAIDTAATASGQIIADSAVADVRAAVFAMDSTTSVGMVCSMRRIACDYGTAYSWIAPMAVDARTVFMVSIGNSQAGKRGVTSFAVMKVEAPVLLRRSTLAVNNSGCNYNWIAGVCTLNSDGFAFEVDVAVAITRVYAGRDHHHVTI
jgi:hypothetical protein